MLWLLAILALAVSLYIDSVRLLMFSVIALIFRTFPMATLSSLCAVIAWAVINLRK